MGGHDESPYAAMREAVARGEQREAYDNRMVSTSSHSVAKVDRQGRGGRPPRTRYLLTPAARAMVATRTVGGDRLWDRVVARQFGL